jgi:hypothetical protein
MSFPVSRHSKTHDGPVLHRRNWRAVPIIYENGIADRQDQPPIHSTYL